MCRGRQANVSLLYSFWKSSSRCHVGAKSARKKFGFLYDTDLGLILPSCNATCASPTRSRDSWQMCGPSSARLLNICGTQFRARPRGPVLTRGFGSAPKSPGSISPEGLARYDYFSLWREGDAWRRSGKTERWGGKQGHAASSTRFLFCLLLRAALFVVAQLLVHQRRTPVAASFEFGEPFGNDVWSCGVFHE